MPKMSDRVRAFLKPDAVESRALTADSHPFLTGTRNVDYGRNLTVSSSLRLSAVYACIRLLSDVVSSFPVEVYEASKDGFRKPYNTPVEFLDDPRAAPNWSLQDVIHAMMVSALTDGNGYVLTPRTSRGKISALIPVDPANVTVSMERVTEPYWVGGIALGEKHVGHLRGLTLPGEFEGVSPLRAARESANTGLQAQKFGGNFFAKGAKPSGVVEMPGEMDEQGRRMFREAWKEIHSPDSDEANIALLTGGAKYAPITIDPKDAQFLEVRQFTISDIARFFGVPPHLIADASNSTSWGSGLAEQNTAFAQYTLTSWVRRIEFLFTRWVREHTRNRSLVVKLNMDAVLRANMEARFRSYSIGVRAGFITQNEVRAMEDRPPLADDELRPPSAPIVAEENKPLGSEGENNE